MRALLAIALVLASCGTGPATPSDAGDDAARPDANRTDAGFDPSWLSPCTITGTHVDLALSPLVSAPGPDGVLEQRAFYVLLVLRTDPAARAAIDGDATLMSSAAVYDEALRDATICGANAACVRASVVIPPADVATSIAATLAALDGAGLTTAVATTLRASHVFERFHGETDGELLRIALTEALVALEAAFDHYAVGELAVADLADVVSEVALASPAGSMTWWEPLSRVTIAATLRAGRDEPVRYEPIDTGENAAALAAIPAIDWAAFPYAALLVPGQGPTDAETMLNPAGAARADLAADRWRAGIAPLVVLSGGHVHPDRTPYSEAIEMKHYLMTAHAMPESAILVDPYARHTTTNLRNVTRVLLRAGVPSESRILVVTDVFQTVYIRAAMFETRCDDELDFRPYDALEEVSRTDTCMTMAPESLTVDASDLLDP